MTYPHSTMTSSSFLPLHLGMILTNLICILCLLSHGHAAEETGKIQANPALAAEMRQRDMLKASVDPFFIVNNKFLNFIQQNHLKGSVITEFIGNLTSNNLELASQYFDLIKPIVITYPGYVALFLFGLLLFIIVPIVGIFWCACRSCCRRCGSRPKPMDGKYARCRRGTFGIVLGVLCTLILAGAVVAFISNDLLHRPFIAESPDNPVTKFNNSLSIIADNMQVILKDFNNQTLLRLGKQVPRVRQAVEDAALDAQNQIIVKSGMAKIIETWDTINKRLALYLNLTQTLQINYRTLTAEYNEFKSALPAMLDVLRSAFTCTHSACSVAMANVDNFVIVFDPAKVDIKVLDRTLEALMAINTTEMTEELNGASDTLNGISETIMKVAEVEIENVIANLNDSRKIETYFVNSERFIRNISEALTMITKALNNQTFFNKNMKPLMEEIDSYRMYACIGVASIILFIILFYYLALCFGACGEPPYEDARFCNRGKGASLMSCGVGFTFVFFPLIMLITMVLFMAGGPAYTEFCRYLLGEMPNGYSTLDSEISHILKSLNVSFAPGFPYPPNLTYHIMGDCRNDSSIVTVFSLNDLINGSTIYFSEVQPSIQSLQQAIRKLDLGIDTSSLVAQGGNFIDMVQKESIETKSFDPPIAELQKPIVEDYETLLATFQEAEPKTMWSNNSVNSTIISLRQQIQKLDGYKAVMVKQFNDLKPFGTIENEIARMRGYLQEFGIRMREKSPFLINIVDESFKSLDTTMQMVLVDAVKQVMNEHASCRVLHEQVKGLVDLVCVNILNPFNGFWLGIGWCLLFLIPAMIFACKLNYLYKKTEYYVKDYEEPDYMSYQGFYPSDNIPLERKYRHRNKQAKARGRTASKSRGHGGGILRHNCPPDPLPGGMACPSGAAGGLNRRGWQHPYTKLPVYPRDAYD